MEKSVAILLASYNGEKFLRKQLDSIQNQTFKNWKLFVMDDSSTDNTLEILKEYQKAWGEDKIWLTQEPNKGSAKNFLSLVCEASIHADYYAYTDQDDIWDADKLERALVVMNRNESAGKPFLYCSTVRLINQHDTPIGFFPLFVRKIDFRNSLVQNIAQGNTIVFNEKARDILKTAGVVDVPVADWWSYMAVAACGGQFFYDKKPSLSYRIHENNTIGVTSFLNLPKKMKRIFLGSYAKDNEKNIAALLPLYPLMTEESRKSLAFFEKSKCSNPFLRLYYVVKSGAFFQKRHVTLFFYFLKIFFKF